MARSGATCYETIDHRIIVIPRDRWHGEKDDDLRVAEAIEFARTNGGDHLAAGTYQFSSPVPLWRQR